MIDRSLMYHTANLSPVFIMSLRGSHSANLVNMKTQIVCVGFILIVLCRNVQCQMGGMMQMMTAIPSMINGLRVNQARAQLTPIVRYVVGDTATPSSEMINFAVIAGSEPVSQTEKDAYLEMMKNVARQTPEVLIKFLKVKNGTYSVDEMKLDSHITKRAMQYAAATRAKKERKRKESESQRQQELEMLRMQQNHELSLIGMIGPNMNTGFTGNGADLGFPGMNPGVDNNMFGTGVDPFVNTGFPQQVVEQPQPAPANNNNGLSPPANVEIPPDFSLFDMLRRHEQNTQVSSPSSSGTSQVTPAHSVPAPQMMPTGNPDMLNFMMLNGGM